MMHGMSKREIPTARRRVGQDYQVFTRLELAEYDFLEGLARAEDRSMAAQLRALVRDARAKAQMKDARAKAQP